MTRRQLLAVVFGCLGLLALAAACGHGGGEKTPTQERMPEKPIEAVLSEHTDSLMALPGVVGTGQGECDGQPCIRVFVVQKSAGVVDKIPSTLDGYTVDVVVTGQIKALESE